MSLPSKPQTRAGMPPRRARVLLGAAPKVGKTETIAQWAPSTTLIVDTQNGTLMLEGEHYVQHVKDWPAFVRTVDDICRGGHMFHTIGLDLVNDLWRFCDHHYGKNGNPASAMDDYGRSSAKARAAFTGQIGRLLAAPVGIWFLTHLLEKTDKTGELVLYKPDIDKSVYAYIAGAVDFLWLAETQNNGSRIVHTQPTKHFEAGSRVSVPSPLPLDVGEVARAMDRALNPQEYDENGARKVAEAPVAPVEAAPEPPAPEPPTRQDVERTEASDVTPLDPWTEAIAERVKPFKKDLRAGLGSIGVQVPENVGSWGRVLGGLDARQRALFESWLLAQEEAKADVPWQKPQPHEQFDIADAEAS